MIDDQLSLFPEAHARRGDPWTSHAAARTVAVTRGQWLVLDLLDLGGPMTDEALVDLAGRHGCAISPSGARTRRSELVTAGLVEQVDETVTSSGRRCFVWDLTRAGRITVQWGYELDPYDSSKGATRAHDDR